MVDLCQVQEGCRLGGSTGRLRRKTVIPAVIGRTARPSSAVRGRVLGNDQGDAADVIAMLYVLVGEGCFL
jgi:hypothetical protein